MPLPYRNAESSEPNHRQEMALERIEFAVGELATVLLSYCGSQAAAAAAITDVRKALAPALAEILSIK